MNLVSISSRWLHDKNKQNVYATEKPNTEFQRTINKTNFKKETHQIEPKLKPNSLNILSKEV
jgi:hypothetical protein